MKEGIYREKALSIIDREMGIEDTPPHVVTWEMQRVRTTAVTDSFGLKDSLDSRVLLRWRGISGQHTQHLSRGERGNDSRLLHFIERDNRL